MPSFSRCTSAMRSCCGWDAGQRIFDVLAQAHKDITECDDQDDFDSPFCKLYRERNQTLLQIASVSSRWCEGPGLPQASQDPRTSGQAHRGGDHGLRNFSDLLEAIQILARRPMNQVSSSFPSRGRNDDDDGWYHDECDEFWDHDLDPSPSHHARVT